MIPKVLHYCWFGSNPLPPKTQKCINSWKRLLPDYEIKKWDESNVDLSINDYTRFCNEHKLWAYLSDYIRVKVIEAEGGLYFDTDVELIKRPDALMNEDAWVGWETSNWVNTGLGFGAHKHHEYLKSIIHDYENLDTESLKQRWNETHSLTGSPRMNTFPLFTHGLIQNGMFQKIVFPTSDSNLQSAEVIILPADYLCPLDDLTGELKITSNTISIHWYTKSANGKFAYYKSRIVRPIRLAFNKLKRK